MFRPTMFVTFTRGSGLLQFSTIRVHHDPCVFSVFSSAMFPLVFPDAIGHRVRVQADHPGCGHSLTR